VKIILVYICVTKGYRSREYASRFVSTYNQFSAGAPHEVVIVFNGGRPANRLRDVFAPIPHGFHERDNSGWDIGAYQDVAWRIDADLMLCFGEQTYFHKSDWLFRFASAFLCWGPGMYGAYASYLVSPHLNTTSFACSPQFIREYPIRCQTRRDRYEFEHGAGALWRQIARKGFATKLVTWDGEWDHGEWRTPQNILWRGDQSNCLTWCQHTDRYNMASPETKERWAAGADGVALIQKPEHTVLA
jgi:hypothetical protein